MLKKNLRDFFYDDVDKCHCDDDSDNEDDEIDRVDEGRHLETISGAVSHKGLSHTHMVAMHIKCT